MLSYKKKLYSLVKKLGFTSDDKTKEVYADLEKTFLDRWITTLVSKLTQDDQKLVAEKLQSWATPAQLYEFLDASLDDIDTLNQQILDDFIKEYKVLMGFNW